MYALESFEGASQNEIMDAFRVVPKDREGVNILLASYSTPSYEGYAFVLFEKAGKLFEVNASHCSCYGLEDQWAPEEVTAPELRHRLSKGTFGNDYAGNFHIELHQVLDNLQQSHTTTKGSTHA